MCQIQVIARIPWGALKIRLKGENGVKGGSEIVGIKVCDRINNFIPTLYPMKIEMERGWASWVHIMCLSVEPLFYLLQYPMMPFLSAWIPNDPPGTR